MCRRHKQPTSHSRQYLLSELTHHIRDSGAKVIVLSQGVLPVALEAAADCGIPRADVYVLEDDWGNKRANGR